MLKYAKKNATYCHGSIKFGHHWKPSPKIMAIIISMNFSTNPFIIFSLPKVFKNKKTAKSGFPDKLRGLGYQIGFLPTFKLMCVEDYQGRFLPHITSNVVQNRFF